MNKPMYCPISQMNITTMDGVLCRPIPHKECTPDCAWAVNDGKEYWCRIASEEAWHINTRPLEEDGNE